MLETQRANTVREQRRAAEEDAKLAALTCVICMEELTNITATHCGE